MKEEIDSGQMVNSDADYMKSQELVSMMMMMIASAQSGPYPCVVRHFRIVRYMPTKLLPNTHHNEAMLLPASIDMIP